MPTYRSKLRVFYTGEWSDSALIWMVQGHKAVRNGKTYAFCKACRSIVRIDKPLIGSWHFCVAQKP
jgi:hypothetical protein